MAVDVLTLEQVLAQAQALSSLDKVRLMERLAASIEREMEALSGVESDASRVRSWQATIDRTAGALADDPLERPPQGTYERRDEIA